MSAAFFATGNVAISRKRLLDASKLLVPGTCGPFDSDFSEYGWEDLELGGSGSVKYSFASLTAAVLVSCKFAASRACAITDEQPLGYVGSQRGYGKEVQGYSMHPWLSAIIGTLLSLVSKFPN